MCGVGGGPGQGGLGVGGGVRWGGVGGWGLWPPAPSHMWSVPTSRVFSVFPIFRSNFKNAIFAQMKIQHFDYLSSKLFFPFAFKDTFFSRVFSQLPKQFIFFFISFRCPASRVGGGGEEGRGGGYIVPSPATCAPFVPLNSRPKSKTEYFCSEFRFNTVPKQIPKIKDLFLVEYAFLLSLFSLLQLFYFGNIFFDPLCQTTDMCCRWDSVMQAVNLSDLLLDSVNQK